MTSSVKSARAAQLDRQGCGAGRADAAVVKAVVHRAESVCVVRPKALHSLHAALPARVVAACERERVRRGVDLMIAHGRHHGHARREWLHEVKKALPYERPASGVADIAVQEDEFVGVRVRAGGDRGEDCVGAIDGRVVVRRAPGLGC